MKNRNCGCSDDMPKRQKYHSGKIPKELKFNVIFNGGIYPPGRCVSTEVRLYGYVVFFFEPSTEEKIYHVKMRDVKLSCFPFVLPVDVDNDGIMEGVEIRELELGPESFDIEACRGKVNVETSYFEFDWAFKLTIPPKLKLPIMKEMKEKIIDIKIPDRGYLDFKKRKFEIHRGVFNIDKGPISGYLVRGSGKGEVGGYVPPEIDLNVAIATTGHYGCGDAKRERVTICEGDDVFLCWDTTEISDADSVSIKPGGYKNLNLNGIKIITPAPTSGRSQIEYIAETVGAKENASDSIWVDFYTGDWLAFQAQPDWLTNCWRIEIPPEAYSPKIFAEYIKIITSDLCFDWKDVYVQYRFPPPPVGVTNAQPLGFEIHGYNDVQITGKHMVAGTWEFYPLINKEENKGIDIKDVQQPFCFALRGSCPKPPFTP